MYNLNQIKNVNKLILLITLVPFFCFSQIKISGKVASKSESIPFANVIVTDQSNKIVQGVVTDETGHFEFKIQKGIYNLAVNHMNFESYSKEITTEKEQILDDIVLNEKSNTLNTVVVNNTPKKRITRTIDRMIVNVEDNPSAMGGTAIDALKTLPGLVLKNDEIVMLGKSNVRIMVDGRMIQLSGDDLKSFLNSISANDIKEIEIITTPPAKYEAEGNSGIVNIVYKRGKNNSWNNGTYFSYTQAKLGKESLRNTFSYQKDKISLLFSLGYERGNEYTREETEIFYTDQPNKLSSDQDAKIKDFSTRFLLDYKINPKTKIGVQYLGGFKDKDSDDTFNTSIFNNSGDIDSYLKGKGVTNTTNRNNSLNTHLESQWINSGKMFIDLDFLDYTKRQNSNIVSGRYNSAEEFVETNFANLGNSDQRIVNYSLKADFEHPLSFFKLSYGLKFSNSNTEYDLNNYNAITGEPVFNPDQSNQFEFGENIQSAYVNVSKKFNDKWETQIGLRSENTQTRGESDQLDLLNRNEYLKFFPTFYLTYHKNENNTFMLSYNKRLSRPSYFQLNPSRYYISSQLSYMGNPYLTPSYNNGIDFTHVYKNNLSTKVSFNVRTDSYNLIFDVNDTTKEQISTYKNYYTNYRYSLSESYQIKYASWLKSENSLFLMYSKSKKTDNTVDAVLVDGCVLALSINNFITFNESKSIVGEVDFSYNTPYNDNIYHSSQASSLDLAVTFKSILKDLNLTAGFYDVFNTSRSKIFSEVNGIKQNFINYPSNRYFRLSLAYNFGNKKISTKERNFGNEDERRRSN
ncbi:Outer membrane receptor proteins, mostly Fe transport [Flavobacterium chilense]|uniref:Outer membrane receptor proteins, mostly Fe transport n=1 Tax=Flavobacterium chilense TaxID=946677 RepID=A0A1M6XDW9_9FLAO|nr:Outer membrane receptor proteins, mostly Fe transport [Flavobacterium chilense]